MMRSIKLSILITFQKGIDFLRDCLESIKLQELDSADYEIILVGSDEEEGFSELISTYENINFYKLIGNCPACRNLAINKATGKYLYILDSDDFLMPGALKSMLDAANENNADIVFGNKEKTWYGLASCLQEMETMLSAKQNDSEKSISDNNATTKDANNGISIEASSKVKKNKKNTGDDDSDEAEKSKKNSKNLSDSDLEVVVSINERENIGKSSASHILFRNNNIKKFNEDLTYFSDLEFTTSIFLDARVICEVDALYMKRNHNDAIRFPQLDQIQDESKPNEWLVGYKNALKVANEYEEKLKNPDNGKEVSSSLLNNNFDKGDKDKRNNDLSSFSEGENQVNNSSLIYQASTDNKWNNNNLTRDEAGENSGISANLLKDIGEENNNVLKVDDALSYVKKCKNYVYHQLCRQIIRKFLRTKHPEGYTWKQKTVENYANQVKNVPYEIYKKMKFKNRRVLKSFSKGKINKGIRQAKISVFRKKKKGLFGSWSQWKWAIYKRIFRRMKVKSDLVIFESFLGKSYGDSCKYIYEYMLEKKLQYKFVWVIDNKGANIPGNPKKVKPLSLRYFYYVARNAYWINNMRQPAWYEKRPGTFFLETWHGTPLKRLVFDMEEVHSASPRYKMTFYKQSRVWDYLVSDNPFSTKVFESAFQYPKEQILELGYPRNDLLYSRNNRTEIDKIKKSIGLPLDKKIILYAPTWRDDEYYAPGQYKFNLPLDLLMLQEKLNDDYIILLRTHYFIADNLVISDAQKSFVKDVSRYNDIGELYLISDICITDYSSVFFDYANLRRPILFYVYDFEKYKDTLRGFYIDMEKDLPGPLLFDSKEVVDAIVGIESVKDKYQDKYNEFYDKFCSLDDGFAAKRIVETVFRSVRL